MTDGGKTGARGAPPWRRGWRPRAGERTEVMTLAARVGTPGRKADGGQDPGGEGGHLGPESGRRARPWRRGRPPRAGRRTQVRTLAARVTTSGRAADRGHHPGGEGGHLGPEGGRRARPWRRGWAPRAGPRTEVTTLAARVGTLGPPDAQRRSAARVGGQTMVVSSPTPPHAGEHALTCSPATTNTAGTRNDLTERIGRHRDGGSPSELTTQSLQHIGAGLPGGVSPD